MNQKHKKAVRIASVVIFFAVMIILTAVCWPVVRLIQSDDGRMVLKDFVSDNIFLGVLMFLALQILQIVVALIPGAVVQVLGGVLFGGFWGTLLCVLGTFLGEAIVFYVVRRFGKPFVEAVIDSKNIKRLSFLQDTKKCELAVFILFLIPVMPKDALTYIAPLTRIKPSSFFLLSMLARSPWLVVSNVFGSSLESGNLLIMVVMVAIVAVGGVVGILYKDRIINAFRSARKTRNG